MKKIGILLVALLVLASTQGCRSTMPSEVAQELASDSYGSTYEAPPRGLGPMIQRYVEEFDELAKNAWEFDYVTTFPTKDEMERMRSGQPHNGYWVLKERGRRAYFEGNIEHAVVFASAAAKAAPSYWPSAPGDCLFDKAWFQAEAGQFVQAQKTLYTAMGMYSANRESKRRWIYKRTYLSSNAKAAVEFARGNLDEAKTEYLKALAALKTAQDAYMDFEYARRPSLLDVLRIGIARCLLWEGKLSEAEFYARQALSFYGRALPHAFILLSRIFYEQGRYDDAEVVAQTAVNMVVSNQLPGRSLIAKNSLVRARARQALALALLANEKGRRAFEELEKIRSELEASPETYRRLFDGTLERGLTLLLVGRPEEAMRQFAEAKRKQTERLGAEHYSVYELEAFTAVAKKQLGEEPGALKRLHGVIPKLQEHWRDPSGESVTQKARLKRLALIVESYLELITDHGSPEDIETGFAAACALQSRTVGRAVNESASRSLAGEGELARLIRSKQDLEMRLAAQQNRLLIASQASEAIRNQASMELLKEERDKFQRAITSLENEIEKAFPDYAALFTQPEASLQKARQSLRKTETLLSFFVGERATYVWAVNRNGEIGFVRSDLAFEEVLGLVSSIRASVKPGVSDNTLHIGRFDLDSARRLYQGLLKPLEAHWKSSKALIAVANNPLGQLPLSLLPTKSADLPESSIPFAEYRDVPWLIRTHSVTKIPSVTSLIQLRNAPHSREHKRLYAGFGDPWFNRDQALRASTREPVGTTYRSALRLRAKPRTRALDCADLAKLPRLPETAIEVKRIAEALGANPDADVFIGDRATESRVKEMDLSDRGVLVFATHGLEPGDVDGLLQPALALSSPAISGEVNNDGLFTMGEIMWLRLDADCVVLSACNTAAPDGQDGEALSGLGQAFLYAGAKSLLLTSWAVETTSALALTTKLFELLAAHPDMPRPEALRQAKQALMDKMKGDGFSYAHPLFWAPFIIVGN